MSVQPVTTANRHEIRQQMEMNLRTTTTGLSSVASTIAPATAATSTAPAASGGFCATISAWVSSVVEGIRNCLAKLPLIGSCFGSTPASSTQPASTTAVDPLALADANLVNIIKTIFKPAPAAATSAATSAGTSAATSGTTVPGGSTIAPPAVPAVDVQNFALDQFNALQTPAARWEALATVLSACNATDAIGGQFFAALAPAMQEQFRGEMYRVNAGSVFPAGGHDHGAGFGHFMVAHQIRSDVAKTAARNLQANPVVTP